MKKIVIVLVGTLCGQHIQSINIKLLKGTHTIVPAGYSPVMGLASLEGGIAEQLYRMSPQFQKKQIDEILEKNPNAMQENPEFAKFVASMKSRKNSATEDLIMEMFHIVRGSFKRTNAPDNPVRQLKPEHIGKILKIIQDSMNLLKNIDDLPAKQAQEKIEIKAKMKALEQEAKSADKARISAIKLEKSVLQKTLDKTKTESPSDYVDRTMRSSLVTMLSSLGFKNEKGRVLKWNSFVDAIAGSLKESTGPNRAYAENTTQDLLLSYLLVKSDTREDLQNYFKGFLGSDAPDFVLPEEEYSAQDIEQILAAKTESTQFREMGDLISACIFKEKYGSSLPKIVDNKEATYKGIPFADCMDTTMRMLANIVTYKQSEGKVGVAPQGLSLNTSVENFYNSDGLNSKSAEVGNSKVHQAWAQVIENVPGCVYAQIGTNSGNAMDISNLCDGVIPSGHNFATTTDGEIKIDGVQYEPYSLQVGPKSYTLAQKKVGDRTYLLVPKDSELTCCEMMPNSLNLVTGLNHIFDLNLYSNLEQIFEPDFVSKYFDQICEKFNWTVDPAAITELDQAKSIDIAVKTTVGEFSINLYEKKHGNISVSSDQTINVDLVVESTTSEAMIAQIISSGLKNAEQLPKEFQTARIYNMVPSLDLNMRFTTSVRMLLDWDLLNDNDKEYLKSLLLSLSFDETSVFLNAIVENFASLIATAQLGDFLLGIMHTHDVSYKTNLVLENVETLIKANLLSIENAVSLAELNINNSNQDIRALALSKVENLINQDFIKTPEQVSKILSLVSKNINNIEVLKLFNTLANKVDLIQPEYVSTLLSIIEQTTASSDFPTVSIGATLLQQLTGKKLITEKYIDQAWSIIENGINNSSSDSQIEMYSKGTSIHIMDYLVNENLVTASKVSDMMSNFEKIIKIDNPEIGDSFKHMIMTSIGKLVDKKMLTAENIENFEQACLQNLDEQSKETLNSLKSSLSGLATPHEGIHIKIGHNQGDPSIEADDQINEPDKQRPLQKFNPEQQRLQHEALMRELEIHHEQKMRQQLDQEKPAGREHEGIHI
ncbi:MAG: hypothetical protein NTZ68_02445 [Candidatus Dependentiae bacterium]|nr:hypothetical protein [Candidatus Dependentiae bacterium]